ncbi:MAG: transposase [Actinomycetota bacterium]|nr:transposase [Actinomycetota bacterium]
MAFGGRKCPGDHVQRTFRVKVMATPAQKRRAWELIEDAGDVWAWVIDRQNAAFRGEREMDNNASALWDDQRSHGPFGELSAHCTQDVVLSWQRSFFETAKRRKAGDLRASYPMRKRRYVPVTWRKGEFEMRAGTVDEPGRRRRPAVELSTRRGKGRLTLGLSHDHPYEPDKVRSVRLVPEGDELFVDITARVAVTPAEQVPGRVAGADPGVIHPWAVTSGDRGLLVSGRGMRAEERLHLEDAEARDRVLATKRKPVRAYPGKPRQEGSRRYKHLAAKRRKADAKNRRRIAHANYTAANLVARFVTENKVSLVRYGDPRGITGKEAGAIHNRRVHRWPRAKQRDAVVHRLEEIAVKSDGCDEGGTSSTCPACGARAIKSGRRLACANPECKKVHHRDLAGSQNIAQLGEDQPMWAELTHVEHRRVGRPPRRDRRRQRWVQARRAGVAAPGNARTRASGPPSPAGGSPESSVTVSAVA